MAKQNWVRYRPKIKDLKGRVFGRLKVVGLSHIGQGSSRCAFWVCSCSCGSRVVLNGASLRNGRAKSCGCIRGEKTKARNFRHGMAGTPEYRCWKSMIERCEKPGRSDSKYYFDKGITVCKEWRNSFQKFFDHIGPKPSDKHSIDRIDANGNYEPGNVRWATALEQRHNRSL